MNKLWQKLLSLITACLLVLLLVPTQPAKAAGEPIAPTLLQATASYPGDLAISLTWIDNSSDETAFEIERCAGAGCTDFTLIATRNTSIWGPWFNDVGLTENTAYTYRVRAINSFGPSEYSNLASATTSYARPDGQASNLTATFVNGMVELSWTENATNETRFEVERYEVGAGGTEYLVIATLAPDTTSYTDATALQGTTYDYRIVPWRYDVSGGAPEVATVQTGTGISAPTDFKAKAASQTSIRLSWKGKFSPGAQVMVQRLNCDLYGCFGWTVIGQVDAANGRFTDTGLLPDTSYTYRIRAITATSVSPFTDSITALTH